MNRNIAVRDIMIKNVITIHPEDSLNIVNMTFERHGFHHIPVTDHGKVVGIVTKDDLLRLSSIKRQFSEKEYKFLKVKDFMTSKVVSISPEDSVGLVADIFLTNSFHAVPVVEDKLLVGIVTTHDVIKYAFKNVIEEEV